MCRVDGLNTADLLMLQRIAWLLGQFKKSLDRKSLPHADKRFMCMAMGRVHARRDFEQVGEFVCNIVVGDR